MWRKTKFQIPNIQAGDWYCEEIWEPSYFIAHTCLFFGLPPFQHRWCHWQSVWIWHPSKPHRAWPCSPLVSVTSADSWFPTNCLRCTACPRAYPIGRPRWKTLETRKKTQHKIITLKKYFSIIPFTKVWGYTNQLYHTKTPVNSKHGIVGRAKSRTPEKVILITSNTHVFIKISGNRNWSDTASISEQL